MPLQSALVTPAGLFRHSIAFQEGNPSARWKRSGPAPQLGENDNRERPSKLARPYNSGCDNSFQFFLRREQALLTL